VVRVQPNCLDCSSRRPREIGPPCGFDTQSGFDTLSVCLSADGWLSRADGLYNSEHVAGSSIGLKIGCNNLQLCFLRWCACEWHVLRGARPIPASQYASSAVNRLPSLSVGSKYWEFWWSLMPLTLTSQWRSPSWRSPMGVMMSPRTCWSHVWHAYTQWLVAIIRSCWHTYICVSLLLVSSNP